MKTVISLDRQENLAVVEKEFRDNFIHEVLTAIGIPLADIWYEPTLSAANKLKLVSLLNHHEIEIFEDIDGEVEIAYKKQVIAKYHKPTYILKTDLSLERNKQVYLEMITEYTSLYHENPP